MGYSLVITTEHYSIILVYSKIPFTKSCRSTLMMTVSFCNLAESNKRPLRKRKKVNSNYAKNVKYLGETYRT